MGARLRWISLLVASALLIAASPPSRTARFTYQADQRMYSDFEREVARLGTPAGHVNSFGQLWFTPTATTFQLRVDDAAALPGETIPAIIWQLGDTEFVGGGFCLADGAMRVFRGLTPGQEVVVILDGATAGEQLHTHRCDGFATVGTATVTLD